MSGQELTISELRRARDACARILAALDAIEHRELTPSETASRAECAATLEVLTPSLLDRADTAELEEAMKRLKALQGAPDAS